MTVIAWDGKILACDSRSTLGTTLVSDSVKKLQRVVHPNYGPMVFGFAGALPLLGPWLATLNATGFTKVENDGGDDEMSLTGLFISDVGLAFWADTNGTYFPITYPTALGCAVDIAQHYLNDGAKAVDAVRAAIRSDVHCGGSICSYDYAKQRYHNYKA